MNRNIFLTLFFYIAGLPPALSQRWQQQVDYTIDVTLTDSTHSLDGQIQIRYINHSPDTLSIIWIRCWPNAFKNDRTAFSEQLIRDGRTDFYFSDKARKGYLNRLEFRADGQLARMEDHPLYIDVIRVLLPHPLLPGDSVTLSTPFHVQLPDNFAGSGYRQGIYQVTQWYPKPAVFDVSGWHPYPYTGREDSYSEFGDFDVHITVPPGFTVAATGELHTPADDAPGAKTWHFVQSNIPDFAWFASRRFRGKHDTLQLPSGRIIDLFSYYLKPNSPIDKAAIPSLKKAIRYYSIVLGDYPFPTATTVETHTVDDFPFGPDHASSSWPGIIAIDARDTAGPNPGLTIGREIVDNWLSIAVGVDGHRYPWMTRGLADYYYTRYRLSRYRRPVTAWGLSDEPDTFYRLEELLDPKYALDTPLFDSCMRIYFREQQFHHAGPEDLKKVFPAADAVPPSPSHRPLVLNVQLIPHPVHRNALNISPAVGFNNYDHWMVGVLIHNFNLPADHWQLVAAPLYSASSHQWNGLLHFGYSWYPRGSFHRIDAGINGSRFSTISGTDSSGHAIFGGFYKVVPYLRLFFRQPSALSTLDSWLEAKTFLIGEKGFNNYVLKSADSLYYPVPGKYDFRYLDQLSFTIRDKRVLYPWSVNVQVQQAASFYRINLDMHYFFNYATAGGLDVRVFGAKFGYLGARDPAQDLTQFEPKLTAVRGGDDYTYGNYFIGRNDFDGLASQQIMMRDGDLKLRTDLFQGLQGRSDNWVAAVNLKSTLPPQVFPVWLPLRLFLDLGTYSQAWSDNPPTSHFLYVGGLELDLFHNVLHIYAPLVYSSDFSNQLKTVPGQNGFFQKVSFSIDFQQLPFQKLFGYTPF